MKNIFFSKAVSFKFFVAMMVVLSPMVVFGEDVTPAEPPADEPVVEIVLPPETTEPETVLTPTEPTSTSTPETTPKETEEIQVQSFSLLIQDQEESVTYAPYCGDEMVNQDWEQCDGGAFCTEQCLYPLQESCPLDIKLAKIDFNEVSNDDGNVGDMTSDLYLGSAGNVIPSGTWFDLSEIDGNTIGSFHDVPGLAVRRFADKLKVRMYGSHPGSDVTYNEHADGFVSFYGAAFAEFTEEDEGGSALENPFDGIGPIGNDRAHGEDEIWSDEGTPNFWLNAITLNDGFAMTFGDAETACVVDPIDEEDGGFIQGRKFRDVNENGNFDAVEKNANGNPNRLDDWKISLFDNEWNLVDSMLTGNDDANWNPNHLSGSVDKGQYRFTNLAAGTYYVCEETQEGWEQTSPRETVLETTIANAENISTVIDPNNDENYCYEVELTENQEQTNVKFGNIEIPEIPEQDFLKVHIVKYLDGQLATTGPETGYPMQSTWQTANLSGGATSSGNYILGNFHGGNPNQYGADTSSMESPAYYSTHELTTEESEGSPVLPADAQCVEDKYRLVGYSTGNTLEAAELASKSTTTPEFYGLTNDKYIIVWNEDCDTESNEPNQPPVITVLGDNPFSLTVGNSFVDPFASSTDAEDGDLTSLIATSTDLNINATGTYSFVYSVTDSDNATAYATRTINVIEQNNENPEECQGDECDEEDNGGGGSSGSRSGGGGGGSSGSNDDDIDPDLLAALLSLVNPPAPDNFGQGGAELGAPVALETAIGLDGATEDVAGTTTDLTASTTDDNADNLAAVGALGGFLGLSWWWWILILILLGIVAYYIFRDKENNY